MISGEWVKARAIHVYIGPLERCLTHGDEFEAEWLAILGQFRHAVDQVGREPLYGTRCDCLGFDFHHAGHVDRAMELVARKYPDTPATYRFAQGTRSTPAVEWTPFGYVWAKTLPDESISAVPFGGAPEPDGPSEPPQRPNA